MNRLAAAGFTALAAVTVLTGSGDAVPARSGDVVATAPGDTQERNDCLFDTNYRAEHSERCEELLDRTNRYEKD